MEELFEKKDKPEDLEVVDLINKLSDSLTFLGTANVEINTVRKIKIKKD